MALVNMYAAVTVFMVISPLIARSAKIIMLPTPTTGSHVSFFSLLGAELMSHGHDVTVVSNEQNSFLATKAGVKVIKHNVTSEAEKRRLDEMVQNKKKEAENPPSPLTAFKLQSSMIVETIEFMFQDKEFMSQIEKGNFDMAIVDGLDFARPMYIIPYRFNIRYITLTARHDPWMAGVPAMPSVEPFFGNAIIPADLGSFFQRTINTVMYLASYYYLNNLFDNNLITKWAPNKPTTTFSELMQRSELFLVNLDPMCLEHAMTAAPNYKFVHGLSLNPSKPLPDDLNKFVEGSGDAGVIVVSFGSVVLQMPNSTQLAFFNAFRQIPQRVVMKSSGTISEEAQKVISSNVLVQKWIPQNDLLGNPKVKLFITHGGNNGQLEAVFHGIPMITLPCHGDQFHNAKRVEYRGYGKTLDMKTFSAEELLVAIKEISDNPKYAEKIEKCSAAFRSLENPRQIAAQWIEHVLEHGGDHFRPPGLGVPLCQWFMVDIIAVFVILVTVLFLLLLSICRRCIRYISKGNSDQQKIPKKAQKHSKKD